MSWWIDDNADTCDICGEPVWLDEDGTPCDQDLQVEHECDPDPEDD